MSAQKKLLNRFLFKFLNLITLHRSMLNLPELAGAVSASVGAAQSISVKLLVYHSEL
jgi:hypothetical protein